MDTKVLILVVNGISIVFSCTLAFILLWSNWRKGSIQLFALVTLSTVFWNLGSLLFELGTATTLRDTNLTSRIFLETGFVGSGLAIYALTVNLVRLYSFRVKILLGISLCLMLTYQVIVVLVTVTPLTQTLPVNPLYLLVIAVTLFIVFRFRNRLDSSVLQLFIVIFLIGQLVPLLNTQISAATISLALCSTATVGMGFTLMWREIISPLQERSLQIVNMREVSQSVSARIDLNALLEEILDQAIQWLRADGAGIFLQTGSGTFNLVASRNLPNTYGKYSLKAGEGIIGLSIQSGKTLIAEASTNRFVEQIAVTFPHGVELFGCVMTSPLINRQQVIGTIVVVTNIQGKLFSTEDRTLIEIMASEASIGIAYNQITQEIESSRHNLEHVLDTTGSPIITVNDSGVILYGNKKARELQENGFTLLPNDWKAEAKSQVWYERRIESRYYTCRSIELEGRFPPEWLIVYSDVTREREMSSLRADVIRLTSHDIKNPLQAAIANLDLLRDDLGSIDNTEVQSSLRELDIQLRRIESITSTILGINNEVANRSHRLSNLLEEAVEATKSDFPNRQHQIIAALQGNEDYVQGSREQLKRAFMNLLDNAMKYSPAGATIYLSSHVDNNRAIIQVRDEGVGIPNEMQKHVFRPLFRGQEYGQATPDTSGSGVGLNIVRSIIENHGGKIWFTSEEGKGTTFFVSLPLLNSRENPEQTEVQQS
jgi:signal transduction histidine kinase